MHLNLTLILKCRLLLLIAFLNLRIIPLQILQTKILPKPYFVFCLDYDLLDHEVLFFKMLLETFLFPYLIIAFIMLHLIYPIFLLKLFFLLGFNQLQPFLQQDLHFLHLFNLIFLKAQKTPSNL